jgi:hypothetical protein
MPPTVTSTGGGGRLLDHRVGGVASRALLRCPPERTDGMGTRLEQMVLGMYSPSLVLCDALVLCG